MKKLTKEQINEIMNWCWKNNTIPMKDLFKDMKDSKMRLAITDGGWINVLKLKDFLEEKNE